MIVLRRIRAMFQKEVMHIARDPFTLIFALVMPVVMVLMFGTAIEFNVQDVPTAYVDQDKSPASRTFLEALGSSRYFKLRPVDSPYQGLKLLEQEKVKALAVIPPQFESMLMGRKMGKIQILIDGTDNTSGTAMTGYLAQVQAKSLEKVFQTPLPKGKISVISRFLFNPELNSRWFVVPALAAVVMAILSILLTSLTISREWENGSMELLLSTPVRATEVILGKMMPYAILGLFSVFLLYLLARFLYGLPFVGNHCVFLLGTLLFLVTYLGQGLLVSTLIRSQQAAVQISLMVGLLPTMLFSGFIFPIEHMPLGFQYLTMMFPARWYVQIARDQFLQGSTFMELWLPFLMLFLFAYLVLQLCILKSKGNLEA